ncbi:motility associated factor glycosyltransferase family protein [Butyrivibrio sp. INlla16]|uniref:motility associated factor glycosyltransferase family protein n=1 Tax=Butyrivibrio sp. INlla16 TaxID=1520807 RepID=UPI000882EE62|nr:6-hydroxymethylpterin diphosphokinase MptE-like protein [Butyrivibrio sp. INlla16]SDB60147.1 Uncharacterized conserved protein [Butyrivibrio sp. INlla16]
MKIDEFLRKQNMESFEKRYGEKLEVSGIEEQLYYFEKAKNGETIIFVRGEQSGDDIRLNSSYSPSYEAERWAQKQGRIYRKAIVVMLGISNGSFLRSLMKKMRWDTTFYVFEPNESLFSFLCGCCDITDIIKDNRVTLFITEKQKKLMVESILPEVAAFAPEIIGVITPFYSENEIFNKLCHELEALVGFKRAFLKGGSKEALRCRMHGWKNAQKAHFLPELKEKIPDDIPVVIVAAGPSLNKNVHILKEMKGKCFILSTDRAVGALDKHGIVPDAIVTLDSFKDPMFMDVPVARKAYLICSYQANYRAQEMFGNRCIYYHAQRYEQELFGDKVGVQHFDQGGNVAGGCLNICEALGVKTVILIGQDLAFEGDKHHVDDIEDKDMDTNVIMLEGINGQPVRSSEVWMANRDFIERRIAACPNSQVIDATEGGALIHGSRIMSLREVSEEICVKEYDVDGIMSQLDNIQNDYTYEELLNKIRKWCDDLDELAQRAREVEDLCIQLLRVSKYHDICDPKYAKKKSKLQKLRFEIIDMTVNAMIEAFWLDDIYEKPDILMQLNDNEEACVTLDMAAKYYHNLPNEADSLKKELQKVFDII